MIPILPILAVNKQIIKTISMALIEILCLLLFMAGVYWCGYHNRGLEEKALKAEQLNQLMDKQRQLESDKYVAEKQLESQLRIAASNANKLNDEVENEAKKPANVNCKFSPTGVQIINAAARDKPTI